MRGQSVKNINFTYQMVESIETKLSNELREKGPI